MPFLTKSLLIAACFCLLAITSYAQAREAGIMITVNDQLGNTLSDAEIAIEKSGEIVKKVKTNSSGVAQIHKLAAGEYKLTVSAAALKILARRL